MSPISEEEFFPFIHASIHMIAWIDSWVAAPRSADGEMVFTHRDIDEQYFEDTLLFCMHRLHKLVEGLKQQHTREELGSLRDVFDTMFELEPDGGGPFDILGNPEDDTKRLGDWRAWIEWRPDPNWTLLRYREAVAVGLAVARR